MATDQKPAHSEDGWRRRLHEIIFEAETVGGKLFDVVLLVMIGASIALVMLETVPGVREGRETLFSSAEWALTLLFTVEYVLRLICVRRPLRYALSFFGIVDLLAILPTWSGLFLGAERARSLAVVRAFRLLRVFRVFKLGQLVDEAASLRKAILFSRSKIIVFLATVLTIVTVTGALMYQIEGPENGFTSIPEAVYWAVVTLTTVGYGDITPVTPFGKALTILLTVSGYSLIIVPTGIISAELARGGRDVNTEVCPSCSREGHDYDATYCKYCSARL